MQIFSWNLHTYDVINQVALPLRRTAHFHYDTQSQCPLMALWCCTHSLPSYWIYSVYHYPQKPHPHPICWPHPTPCVDPSPLITISPHKWLLSVKLIVDMTLASKIAVYYNLPPVLSQNRCLPEEWDRLPLPRCTSSAQPCCLQLDTFFN